VFQTCILECKQAGKSVFLSSHILHEVERLCDRVAIIREGHVVDTGALSQLRHLTQINMLVQTAKPLAGLEGIKGVHGIEEQDGALRFQVEHDALGPVMEMVGKAGVIRLESMPPTLEDLFMRHYSAEGGE